ncbi:hypothetical protein AA309_27080 [Microvirga vignae]|uniref:Uncharacterized protein n=1 Tax=Microvirga vignae TaxID=1225564 RepID=A0A0H1R5S4_9HYPH|nr:hypothetical protein AA309_27080 [Microvirga vignae]
MDDLLAHRLTSRILKEATRRQIFFRFLLQEAILCSNTPGLPRSSVRSETTILKGQERHVAE